MEELERYYEDTTAYVNKYYYKYNDKNNLIEKCMLDSKFGTDKKKVYEYDEKGLCVEIQELNPKGERQYRFVKKYDDIEQLYYNWSDTLSNITYRKYDTKGNLLDDGEGTIYKYDDKGNVIEICDFGYEGDLLKKINYEYDNKGILIKDCCFDALNDKKGRLVTKRYSFSRSDSSYSWKYYKEKFKYDRRGNKVEHRSYAVDDDKTHNKNEKETFKYDDMGNLIEYKMKYGKYLRHESVLMCVKSFFSYKKS